MTLHCRQCGNTHAFKIGVTAIITLTPAGPVHPLLSAYRWTKASYCECGRCQHIGIVKTFTTGRTT